MKEMKEMAQYLQKNIGLIIVMACLISPSVWKFIDMIYDGRIETFKTEIESLKSRVKEAEEKKDTFKGALVAQEKVDDWSGIQTK